MIQLSTALSITAPSYFPSSTNMAAQATIPISLKIGNSMNFTAELRPYLTWWRPRNMASTPMRSTCLILNGSSLVHAHQYSREEIGVLTSLPLLRKVVGDLEAARNNGGSSLTLYFTKESHIHTLVNLLLSSGLPIANRRIPELDYCVSDLLLNGMNTS
jgi:hypothetical protein